MTSSVSGQNELNPAVCLATQWARWSYTARSGFLAWSRKDQRSFFFGVLSHIINPILAKLVRSRWLDIGLVLVLRVYEILTLSRSINTQKKNLANIQPSWPHTWSITHISDWTSISGLCATTGYNQLGLVLTEYMQKTFVHSASVILCSCHNAVTFFLSHSRP